MSYGLVVSISKSIYNYHLAIFFGITYKLIYFLFLKGLSYILNFMKNMI